MKQNTLNTELQQLVITQAAAMFPEGIVNHEIPLIIALPAGIHPYNKSSAYYDPAGNAIVLYQNLGRRAIAGNLAAITPTVQHELCHWYQRQILGYHQSTNVHRVKSWSEACYVATSNLWPVLGMTYEQFRPLTSKRVNGSVQTIQREGALTDTELHHWPDSLSNRF